jgi:hypothetical protein
MVEANVEGIGRAGVVNLDNYSTVGKTAAVVDLTNELAIVAFADSDAPRLIIKPSQLPVLGIVEAHPLIILGIGVSHETTLVSISSGAFICMGEVKVVTNLMELCRSVLAPPVAVHTVP